jgi:excinuclease UvrABC nuclease subunit
MNEPESTTHLREAAEKFPPNPGVYIFKDDIGRVLYVGGAPLRVRIRSYFRRRRRRLRQHPLLAQRLAR